MSKGTIISGGTDGRYQVSVQYNVQRAQAEKAANLAKIADLAARISEETDAHKLNVLKLQKLALEKRNEALDAIPESKEISAWCADLTEDLTGDVGLIEVPGESTAFNIQPGHEGNAAYDSARDGRLTPTMAMTPAAAFYNLAMLPGWQKWKPTYRYGTITALSGDTAAVSLEEAISTQQALGVNQSSTLTDVPIEYMNCNGSAFSAGDKVLVKFTGQDWSSPVVVGFKDRPEGCGFFLRISAGSEILIYDLDTEQIATHVPLDSGEGFAVFPCAATGVIDNWLAGKTQIGAPAVSLQSPSPKYTPAEFYNYPPSSACNESFGQCATTECDWHPSGTFWTYDYYSLSHWSAMENTELETHIESTLYVEGRGVDSVVLQSLSNAPGTKRRRIDRTENRQASVLVLTHIYFEDDFFYCTSESIEYGTMLERDLDEIEITYAAHNPFNDWVTDIVVTTQKIVDVTWGSNVYADTTSCEIYEDIGHLRADFQFASAMGVVSDQIENPFMVAITSERFIDRRQYRECGQVVQILGSPLVQCSDLSSCTQEWTYSEEEAHAEIKKAFIGISTTGYGEDLDPFTDLVEDVSLTSAIELFADTSSLSAMFIR